MANIRNNGNISDIFKTYLNLGSNNYKSTSSKITKNVENFEDFSRTDLGISSFGDLQEFWSKLFNEYRKYYDENTVESNNEKFGRYREILDKIMSISKEPIETFLNWKSDDQESFFAIDDKTIEQFPEGKLFYYK